jgi:hypothetical protein
MRNHFLFVCALSAIAAVPAFAGESPFGLTVENAVVFQSRNEARIPNAGTRIDLRSANSNPSLYFAPRIYASYRPSSKHEFRALWAPLKIEGRFRPASATVFQTETFVAGEEIRSTYRFNSYRLSYIYRFDEVAGWRMGLGFTAKIRDAEIALSQGAITSSKSNVGFVPLLHFEIQRPLGGSWTARLDVDGLAAPQGRAFDAALLLERSISSLGSDGGLSAYTGYRTVEGGADNDEVYNFAWFNSWVLGLTASF